MSASTDGEIIKQVMSGSTSDEIAEDLGLSRSRVERVIDLKGKTQTEISNRRKGDEVDIDQVSQRLDRFIQRMESTVSNLQGDVGDLQNNKLDRKFSVHIPKGENESVPSVSEGNLNQYTREYMDGGIKVTEHLIRNEYGHDFIVLRFEEII